MIPALRRKGKQRCQLLEEIKNSAVKAAILYQMQGSLEMQLHYCMDYNSRWITLPKENGYEKLLDDNKPCPSPILCAGSRHTEI